MGNFQAFDPDGNPVPFTPDNIVGVEVPDLGSAFTPALGTLDFAGNPSLTFTDSLNFLNAATFSAGNFTLAFTFVSDMALDYEFVLLLTGLLVDSLVSFDVINTSSIPEPGTFILLAFGLAGLVGRQLYKRRLAL